MQQHAVSVGVLQFQAQGPDFSVVAIDRPVNDLGPIDRIVEQCIEMHKAQAAVIFLVKVLLQLPQQFHQLRTRRRYCIHHKSPQSDQAIFERGSV